MCQMCVSHSSHQSSSQGPVTHRRKNGCSGGRGSGGAGGALSKEESNALWHLSREARRVWLCDVSAVTVSTPTPRLMSLDWTAQGQKATEPPHNLLSRSADNIKQSDLLFKRLKSCCKIIRGEENRCGDQKVARNDVWTQSVSKNLI